MVATIQSNLYQPTFIAKLNVATLNPPKTNSIELSTLGIADVISVFDERIQFIVGARLQRVQIGNYSPITGVATSYYDQSAVRLPSASSPSLGATCRCTATSSRACSRGRPRPSARSMPARPSRRRRPSSSRSAPKLDLGNFATTFSLFQIDPPFGITNPATAIFRSVARSATKAWNG